MRRRRVRLLVRLAAALLLLCHLAAPAALAEERTVVLTSLEWPPYAGASLPGQGASVAVARAAFEAVGYSLEVRFLPWRRALDEARHNPEVAGYFPEYLSPAVTDEFTCSDSMGTSPLGLIHPARSLLEWESEDDLRGLRVATVMGYVNTARFDALVAAGEIEAEAVVDDATVLRLVTMRRVDAGVMDVNVLRYLLGGGSASSLPGSVQLSKRLMEMKTLHLCLRDDDHGALLLGLFNEGLKRIDPAEIESRFLSLAFEAQQQVTAP